MAVVLGTGGTLDVGNQGPHCLLFLTVDAHDCTIESGVSDRLGL